MSSRSARTSSAPAELLPHRASGRRPDGGRPHDGRRRREDRASPLGSTCGGGRSRSGCPAAPGTRAAAAVRMAAGVGLWDAEANSYLLPGSSASADAPGGAGGASDPAAFFNVAFRTDGAVPRRRPTTSRRSSTPRGGATGRRATRSRPATSRSSSPTSTSASSRGGCATTAACRRPGAMDRIYCSRFELSQGADFSVSCFPGDAATCPGQYQGRLQPYAIYIPKKPMPRRGYGLTLLLHSLSANYNQYLGTRNQSQFGERGGGLDRDHARGARAGRVLRELRRRRRLRRVVRRRQPLQARSRLDGHDRLLDGRRSARSSSARSSPTCSRGSSRPWATRARLEVLASLRNVPVLMWNTHGDELVNNLGFQETADALDALGYRYELDAFQPCVQPRLQRAVPEPPAARDQRLVPAGGRLPRRPRGSSGTRRT